MATRFKNVIALLAAVMVVAIAACAGEPVAPTPNIEATVDARVAHERAVDATVEANLAQEQPAKAPGEPKVGDEQTSPSPTIETINYSSYATSDIREWVERAESKMKYRISSIFTFIYPVGKEKVSGQTIERNPFNQHEVILSQNEIETILSSIEKWFLSRPCLAGERHRDFRDEHLDMYRQWLESGADASTMQAVCSDTRIIAMGITEHMRNDEPLEEFQNFLIHEYYHAFQQDLEEEGSCRRRSEQANSNTRWMVEGAAHYFSTSLVEEINGSNEAHSKILQIALEVYNEDSHDLLNDHGPDTKGAAALRLMIEKGMLDEESIMDGSLFHDCARELVFDSNSPEIERIRESWYQIENQGGVYRFKPEALAPWPPARQTATFEVRPTPPAIFHSEAQRLISLGWNRPTSAQTTYLRTSDLSDDSVKVVENGIRAGEDYLGSYGPLRVYVIGTDVEAAHIVAEDFCSWAYGGVSGNNYEYCVESDQGVEIREIAEYSGNNAFAQHSRELETPNQSFVIGNPLQFELGMGSKIAIHEYVHIYQNANKVYENDFGLPLWLEEGSAEFLALYLGQEEGWVDFRMGMADALEAARDLKERHPDIGIQDIETSESRDELQSICDCTGMLQYETGQWATAWLVNRTSLDIFYKSYIPDIVELGGHGSFETHFGLTIQEFYGEFEEFMDSTTNNQLEILPTQ